MMTHSLLARCAPLAIAASAAIPVIPAVAQDATPVIVLPPVDTVAAPPAPAASAAPATPVPDPAPVAATQAEPAPAAATPEQTPPRARAATPQRSAVTRRAAAPSAPANSARDAAPLPATVPVVAPEPPQQAAPVTIAPSDAAAVPEPAATPSADGTDEALVAGLLGAVGLAAVGGVAFAAARRRRRRKQFDAMPEETLAEPVAAPIVRPEPVAVASSAPSRAATVTPVVPASSFAATPPMMPAASTPVPMRQGSHRADGDPIALPDEIPQTFEERDALLKELVAAEPDRANPFTGVRARARRAKLIMQSLGQDFRDRKPRIDLSEYTNRWPALRGWQPATA